MASETWSEIEKGEIIKAFAVFDRNKDGYVDAEELRYALCTYGEPLSTDEAKEVGYLIRIQIGPSSRTLIILIYPTCFGVLSVLMTIFHILFP